MAVRIITDSGSDITQAVAAKWGVTVLPMTICFDKEIFLDDVTLTANEMYSRIIRTRCIPKTMPVSVSDYEKAFAEAVGAGDTVICITMSSGMSDCWRRACVAAERFGEKVTVVDSLNVCAALYAFVRYAEGMVRMGKSHEEIVNRLERDKHRLHVFSLLDTLDYVRKGGQVSYAKVLASSLFQIKPIITADEYGKVGLANKGRGSRDAYHVFTREVDKAGGIDYSLPVCMSYSGLSDQNMCDYMKSAASLFEGHENNVYRAQFGPTIGAYSGPNAFAIGFFHRRIASFY